MTTNNSVNTGLSGATGTVHFVGSTSPTITTPSITTALNDTNGNTWIFQVPIASAVNYVGITNNTTGSAPVIEALGSDSNIILNLQGKGTGGAQVGGTSTNNNATAGFVGEYVESVILIGAAVSVSNNTATDITSISLTAGDWDVSGSIVSDPAAGTTTSYLAFWTSTTSATAPTAPNDNGETQLQIAVPASSTVQLPIGPMRISIASTTTVYLSCFITFAVSTMKAYGVIRARRMR